jgi:serine-type D-Ala-D-Ala carboxypeptidase/endopeptidase
MFYWTAIGLMVAVGLNPAVKAQTGAAGPLTESGVGELQRILNDRVEERRVTGIVVVVRDATGKKRLYCAGSTGKPGVALDGEAVFEIGSVTKTFTASLLADMVVRGEVKLDDPVSKYLPAGVKVPERDGRAITMVELATHSSGLPFLPANLSPDIQRSWAQYTDAQMNAFLAGYTLPQAPGEKFLYSDTGFGLLGHALELRAGKPWEDLVEERIARPLAMTDTRQHVDAAMRRHLTQGHDAAGAAVPAWQFGTQAGLGALRSDTNDLMKYLEANLDPPKGELGEALAMTHVSRRDAFSAKTQVGLGWFIGIPANRGLIFHGGSTPGYNSFVGFDPKTGLAVVVLANTSADISDIGLHVLEPRAALDEDPVVVRELYKELMKVGFENAVEIAAEKKRHDAAYVLPESGVNSLGYRLLEQKRMKEAIEVFKLNVSLYPQSADAFDSLGEAYEDIGAKELSIRNYQRSVELNPKNSNAVEHLKKLRGND